MCSMIKENKGNTTNTNQSTNHIKISVRLQRGIVGTGVTSFTIKKNIIALWLLYRQPISTNHINTNHINTTYSTYSLPDTPNKKELETFSKKVPKIINDFVYTCLNEWDKDTGKGLSDFITERMIKDFLEGSEEPGESEYPLYIKLLSTIRN